MTIQELKSTFLYDLARLYPKEEIQSFFNLLILHRLKLTRADIALSPNRIIQKTDEGFFMNSLRELLQEKPIQYIIGETEFYGLLFKLDKNVLIPRPETEELVDWILEVRKDQRFKTQDQGLKILDIGTGSGCIAVALAKNVSNATVFAIDVSKQALQIAKQNALLNEVEINFIECDILNNNVILSLSKHLSESFQFDIIVSNPPYVRELEKQKIQNNVLENEPHVALFVTNENPLVFYDRIADFAKEYLSENGHLYLEINQYLGKETTNLLQQKGFRNVELKKDVLGNDRMIKAYL